MTEERSYKDDVKLNRFQLETACEDQGGIYTYWSEKATEARAERERLENRLDFVVAQKTSEAYNNPSMLPGGKATEATAKAYVNTHPEVVALKDQVAEAQKQENVLAGAVRGIDSRKAMIEVLQRLYSGQYWGDPNPSRGGRQDQAADTLHTNLNRHRS